METQQSKESIRQAMLEKRLALLPEEAHTLSQIVQKKLLAHPLWAKQERVALYSSVKNEIDTTLLFMTALEKGISVYFPRVEQGLKFYEVNDPSELQKGAWGVMEPKHGCVSLGEKEELGLIVMPGIVFDRKGNRIGYGKGFYDEVLTRWPSIETIALAYDFQVVDGLPASSWDQKVRRILTEKKEYIAE